ncbi:MAG: MmgE/PrpD family protein [Bacteroidetes bacterium]|nr:MmgE/PrpD family protein [Bacteroidota bacterium]
MNRKDFPENIQDLQNYKIAQFALARRYEDIGEKNIDQLKRHLLGGLGSFIHAMTKPAIHKLVRQIEVIGEGGKCKAPMTRDLPYDRAAQLYTALVRYPDFMDNFLGKEATCHPSDNIGPLLAASQYKPTTGKEFLAAMAIAYQIQCRLVQEIPVMIEGIDHTLLLGYSMTASLSRLLGLSNEQAAHALGITGTSISPMVTSRASYTYEWKGFASSFDALNCVGITLLAKEGLTGPVAIFEGPKGFKDVFDMKLDYDWNRETFELIGKCVLKKYNVEVHAQPALEAIDELRKTHNINPTDIEEVEITTFLTAYHIIGSGAYGDRQIVETKEQADHSLFYAAAVLLLDGEIYPEQYEPGRINRPDVQQLLRKVKIGTGFPLHEPVKVAGILDPYTLAYPDKVRAKVGITLRTGETLNCEKEDYHGFFTRPFSWTDTINKFKRLSAEVLTNDETEQLIDTVTHLESAKDMSALINMLALPAHKAEGVS